ncbi:MAG: LysM domain-containing protein [Chloroflexota bacterium]
MKRTVQYQVSLVILMGLALALTACVRPAPGSEGIDVAATATAAALSTVPPLPTQPGGIVLPDNNTYGPASDRDPETQPEAVEPTAVPDTTTTLPTTHVVQPGETLLSISQIYGVSIAEIQQANGIVDPNALTVGQTLTIPAPGTTTTPEPNPGVEQVYIVQAGDNLFRIGLRYGFTAAELAAYNGIPDMTRIYVGQEIRIPPQ